MGLCNYYGTCYTWIYQHGRSISRNVKNHSLSRKFTKIFSKNVPKHFFLWLAVSQFLSQSEKNYKTKDMEGTIHKLCRLKGGGGQKLPILPSKMTTKRGEGINNHRFCDDIVYGRPLPTFWSTIRLFLKKRIAKLNLWNFLFCQFLWKSGFVVLEFGCWIRWAR